MANESVSLSRSFGLRHVWVDRSLRFKLIVALLVIAAFAGGTIAVLNIQESSQALTDEVYESLQVLASLEAQEIGDTLAERANSMIKFSADVHIQGDVAAQNDSYSGSQQEIEAELARLDEQWITASSDDPFIQAKLSGELAHELEYLTFIVADFAEAFITDRYGGLVAASARTSDYYQADETWWQAAYNDGAGAIYIAEPELDESTGVIGVDIAIPVYDQSNQVVGVLRTTLDVTTLIERLSSAELGETGGAGLFLGESVLSSRETHEEDKDHQEHAGHETDLVEILSRETSSAGSVKGDLENHASLIGYATVVASAGESFISDLGWKVIVHQEEGEALAVVDEQVRASWMVAAVVALLVLILGAVIGYSISSPLTRLAGVVARFTEGDLDARAQVGSADEIGQLATNFNAMAGQVKELLSDLETRSQILQERTLELEASQRVALAASRRTDPDTLLGMVVNLIRDQFHLYHVQVYVVDDSQGAAVLRKSTGYAGRRLLQRKHHIPLDRPALVTRAINQDQVVLVDDVAEDPNFMPNPLLPDTRSELVVPLKVGETVVGALDAQDREPGRFGESTVALFQTMTNQIAFLFENSDLLEQVTEQSQALTVFANQLRTAAEIARRLGTILNPERLLQQVVDMLQSHFGLYHAHVYVLDEPFTTDMAQAGQLNGRRLVVQAGSGEVGRVLRQRGHSIPLDAPKSLVARAARTQEAVMVEDTTLESDFLPNPLLPQTRSSISVPLVVGERVLGVLNMQDDRPQRFTEFDLDTFVTLGGQIATALQTADLFEQVQSRYRVSQALAGTQTEDDVLDAMIRVADFYPEAQVTVFTFDEEGGARKAVVRRIDSFESGLATLLEPGMAFPASAFPLLQLITAERSFVSANIGVDERVDPASREVLNQAGAVSLAVLPVTVGGEWFGLIAAASEQEGYFDERKLYLYRSLAEQGATALRTGRLFDEIQRTAVRLRELDRLKSEFLASMSHELRTPLNSIIGYTEIMLMGIDGELDPETHQDVQAIYDNGQHLLSLINDILDLAKIEADQLTLNLEELQVRPLVDAVRSSAMGLLLDKPVELIVDMPEDEELPPIRADRLRMTQVLNNLVSNGIKFTDEGTVTLSVYYERPDTICIEVQDTGIGIAKEDMDKIFDRFHRVDTSEARRTGGTGLGLAITRHLVELHGGTLTVESQLGRGSTFTVRLPVQTET